MQEREKRDKEPFEKIIQNVYAIHVARPAPTHSGSLFESSGEASSTFGHANANFSVFLTV